MAYSTQADLEFAIGGHARLVQATDWDNTGSLDTTRMNLAIAAADAEIDTYLEKQYRTPLTAPIPFTVAMVSARIAVLRLLGANGMIADSGELARSYDADIKWLEKVADGTVTLGVDTSIQKAAARIDDYTERPVSKDVSRAKLRGFS